MILTKVVVLGGYLGKVWEEQASGVRAREGKGTWKVARSEAMTTSMHT